MLGRTMAISVEYYQLDPLLRAAEHPDEDANCETGYSPYPRNINQVLGHCMRSNNHSEIYAIWCCNEVLVSMMRVASIFFPMIMSPYFQRQPLFFSYARRCADPARFSASLKLLLLLWRHTSPSNGRLACRSVALLLRADSKPMWCLFLGPLFLAVSLEKGTKSGSED